MVLEYLWIDCDHLFTIIKRSTEITPPSHSTEEFYPSTKKGRQQLNINTEGDSENTTEQHKRSVNVSEYIEICNDNEDTHHPNYPASPPKRRLKEFVSTPNVELNNNSDQSAFSITQKDRM